MDDSEADARQCAEWLGFDGLPTLEELRQWFADNEYNMAAADYGRYDGLYLYLAAKVEAAK